MRPAPFTMADWAIASVEAEQAVKGGGDQTPRSPASALDRRASRDQQHHGPPGEQSAGQRGAGAPRTPQDPGPGMSDCSRGENPTQEQSDTCPYSVVLLYRLSDGRLLPKRAPCGVRSCPPCWASLRATWARQWADVMGRERVYRLVVDEGEPARMRRRKAYRGHELGHIPAPDGMRVVYTTAEVGERLAGEQLANALARDFQAMPNDGRNAQLSGSRGPTEKHPDRPRTGWLGELAHLEDEEKARRAELGECLGRCRRSLEHIEIIARTMGFFLGRAGPDALVLADPGDRWADFASQIGLVRPRSKALAA